MNREDLAEVPGFEPGLTDPKSAVLPLHHTSSQHARWGVRVWRLPDAVLGAEGRIRTDTTIAGQRFLRPPRLPFRHFGADHGGSAPSF